MGGFDYSQAGAYFVTICTYERVCTLAEIRDGTPKLTDTGEIVLHLWSTLPERFPFVVLDAFVVMPNHIHGVIVLNDPGPEGRDRVALSLGQVIRAFKAVSTRSIRQTSDSAFAWQLDYHDHVVRNERELQRIREYIEANPSQWGKDPENPLAGNTVLESEPWEV